MSGGSTSRKRARRATGYSEIERGPTQPTDIELEYEGRRIPANRVVVPALPSRIAQVQASTAAAAPPPGPQTAASNDPAGGDSTPGSAGRAAPTPTATSHGKTTSQSMEDFQRHKEEMLNILFTREIDPRVALRCNCQSDDPPVYRCTDCVNPALCCAACIRDSHTLNPLHHIQRWTGSYFARDSLNRVKLEVRLGHDGSRCRNVPAKVTKSLVVIHTNGIHRVDFVFCGCASRPPEAAQLLQAGFYPGTWDQPATAFTIKLLEHHHLDSVQSGKSTYDYWTVLRRLTDNTRDGSVPPRYEELQRVSREWRVLKRLKRSGQALGIDVLLPGGSQSVAVFCPACPRPGVNLPDNWKESVNEDNLHVYTVYIGIDGNFQAILKYKKQDPNDVPLLDGRGYFVDTALYEEYMNEHKRDEPDEHTSDCANLKCMQILSARTGLTVAGLLALFCKHSCYWPNTMIDLDAGEKFRILDYAVFMALQRDPEGDLNWILTCDKGCQYGVHLKRRFHENFPSASAAIERVKVLVPKFHLQGHIEQCRYRFSLNYTRYCGRTDGESVERPWVRSNETAKVTRDMNPGHRKDTFEDCNSGWNYDKILTMVSLLLRKLKQAYAGRDAATTTFELLSSATTSAQREAWEKLPREPYFEGKWLHSVYRADRRQLPTYREMMEALQEKGKKPSPNDPLDRIRCPMTFVNLGLEIEEQQIAMTNHVAGLPGPDERKLEQTLQLCLRRCELREDISRFRAMQQVHMPALAPTPVTEDYSHDFDEDYGMPEGDDLDLPSTWADAREREKRGFTELGKTEYKLRCGKAATALAGLRVAIQLRTRFLADKHKNLQHQQLSTRAKTTLDSHTKDVNQHADLYRRQYAALVRLGLTGDDASRFRPLHKADLGSVSTQATSAAGVGESSKAPAWFWGGDRDSDEQEARELDKLTQEELRVRWFRALANLERFTEEVDIVHAELERTLRTHQHMKKLWEALAEQPNQPGCTTIGIDSALVSSGRRAYALKQAAICSQREIEAEKGREIGEQLRRDGVLEKGPRVRRLDKTNHEWSYYQFA